MRAPHGSACGRGGLLLLLQRPRGPAAGECPLDPLENVLNLRLPQPVFRELRQGREHEPWVHVPLGEGQDQAGDVGELNVLPRVPFWALCEASQSRMLTGNR